MVDGLCVYILQIDNYLQQGSRHTADHIKVRLLEECSISHLFNRDDQYEKSIFVQQGD